MTSPSHGTPNEFDPRSPIDAASALRGSSAEPEDQAPRDGAALCRSGGGYRAMLFHLGALWRLNELAYLKRLRRISSVSGGSITAGLLGARWARLGFDGAGVARNFATEIVDPIRKLAGTTIDVGSVLGGVFGPGKVGDRIVKAYDKYLYHGATLQALPTDGDGPRFVINATNVQSGALWRFSRPSSGGHGEGRSPITSCRVRLRSLARRA